MALSYLAQYEENQSTIARAGGIPILTSMLTVQLDVELQAMSALALTEIMRKYASSCHDPLSPPQLSPLRSCWRHFFAFHG